ncbi:hypothetical protein POSPLADRAFT_1034066 [Postia placenta MAD-698-R-SB12]|uniref:Uncharacterized protein n=1 Tax=Postia placenta MAD-698-R-SB12 TaxID=670580 RepID=A0A1X6MYB8_9APHY|nr:hypothetical protein POSPLADRAFT_1034066 [Postia placenta MAD-698-R-SB12]OSX61371.1 hypothetical protein POSPLADRAFT_1034066 [Postia placenta MAD-698-R-SB12]
MNTVAMLNIYSSLPALCTYDNVEEARVFHFEDSLTLISTNESDEQQRLKRWEGGGIVSTQQGVHCDNTHCYLYGALRNLVVTSGSSASGWPPKAQCCSQDGIVEFSTVKYTKIEMLISPIVDKPSTSLPLEFAMALGIEEVYLLIEDDMGKYCASVARSWSPDGRRQLLAAAIEEEQRQTQELHDKLNEITSHRNEHVQQTESSALQQTYRRGEYCRFLRDR